MGRTGVRGRGCLHRYGPNHEIMAVVTRWKKQKNKPIYVERRKLLEFIAVKDITTGLMNIPGGPILGDESKYSVVCRTLLELVFEEQEVERGETFTENDMLAFFASFATRVPLSNLHEPGSGADKLAELLNELEFSATMIYSGYIDDPRNTDNSWVEAEIWNFHYDKEDVFEKKIKNPESKWREVSSNVRINSNEIIADALKEIADLHNGFYS
jgi:ADP-ribose pyrophosphatase